LVDHEAANVRLTTITSFLIGISAVLLLLSIQILSSRYQQASPLGLPIGSVPIVALIVTVMLLLMGGSTLTSAYYEKGVRIDVAVKRARRLAVVANQLIFIALAGLLLVSFEFTPIGLLYAAVVLICPIT